MGYLDHCLGLSEHPANAAFYCHQMLEMGEWVPIRTAPPITTIYSAS